jgi:hypothetical protein
MPYLRVAFAAGAFLVAAFVFSLLQPQLAGWAPGTALAAGAALALALLAGGVLALRRPARAGRPVIDRLGAAGTAPAGVEIPAPGISGSHGAASRLGRVGARDEAARRPDGDASRGEAAEIRAADAEIARRKRARMARRAFHDVPDPLARGTKDNPLSLLMRRLEDLRQLKRLLTDNRVTLLNQWYRTVRRDGLGERDLSDWAYEADRFLISSGFEPATLNRHEAIAALTADVEQIAENTVAQRDRRRAPRTAGDLAFHQRCAISLQSTGWATHVVAEPRADGIDVFAEYRDTIVGLHCRIYTQPVGRDVVEKVFEATRYHCLDAAAVVSPSGFSAPARSLAGTRRVALLDMADLPKLYEHVHAPDTIVALSRQRGLA